MDKEEAIRLEGAFKRERSTVQHVVGARGMEYLWRGLRYSDMQRVDEAIRLCIYNDANRQLVSPSITKPSPMRNLDNGAGGLLFGIAGALLIGAVVVGLEALLVVLLES